jgi:CRP-like cAMP-binding protein
MPPANPAAIRNRLLRALPSADFEYLRPHLHYVSLPSRQVLHKPEGHIQHIYFIEQGLVSALTTMANGSMVDVRMTGAEGVTGLLYLLGAETLPQQIDVQITGTAFQISAALLKSEFDRRGALRRIIMRFVADALIMTSRTAACNRMHAIRQRCARWLLMASDRIESDTIPMTHELLALMLGVRRAGVTVVAGELQRSGIIRYQRGRLTILDRAALEACACECYHLDREQFDWRWPPGQSAPREQD